MENRKVISVYEDQLKSLIEQKDEFMFESNGWSSIVFQFVQKHDLFKEFAAHLKELKKEQESSNADMYYGDIDFILLDYQE